MITPTRPLATVLVLLAGASACGSNDPAPDAETPTAEAARAIPAAAVHTSLAAPWSGVTGDGRLVTVSGPDTRLTAGSVRLLLSADDGGRAIRPHSVDLVSPTMPMHGVTRFSVEDGVVSLEIPMEGRWALYVNLDPTGDSSAEFFFDAAPGESPGDIHHDGGMM